MCNYCLWVLLLGREGGGGSLLAEGSRGGQSVQGFLTKLTWWLQLKQQSCPLAFFPGCPEIREHLGFPLWGKWWGQHPSNVMFLSLEHTSHCPAHSLFVLAGSPASICLGLTQGSLVKWLQWLNSLKLQELIFFLIVFAFWCSPCVQFARSGVFQASKPAEVKQWLCTKWESMRRAGEQGLCPLAWETVLSTWYKKLYSELQTF